MNNRIQCLGNGRNLCSFLKRTFKLKATFLAAVSLISANSVFAQVGISSSSITPDASSILELRSTTSGFLPPRMTTTQRDAITSPATGLLIYNTSTNLLNYYTGSSWTVVSSGTGVSSVSVTTANGVSGSVANATTTPAISLTLGAITPSSVAATGSVTGSNLSGNNTGDVTLAGQNYLSITGQAITANAVDLSGLNVTGTLAASRFGALTGDVTNSAGSYATTIANGAVTFGKMQNISAPNKILGRYSAGAGSPQELTIGTGLSLDASGNLTATGGAGTVTSVSVASANGFAGTVATATTTPAITISTSVTGMLKGNGTAISAAVAGTDYQVPLTTGDVTTSGATATIANSAVTLSKMANMATSSLIYRKTAGSGAPEVNTLATLKTDLGLTGTNSGDQTITLTGDVTGSGTGSFATAIATDAVTTTKILDGSVTYSKLQNVSTTDKVLGRVTAGAGDVEEISTTGTGNVVRAISPIFTGTPTLPTGTIATTQSTGNNTTAIATTAFVTAAVPNSSYRNILQVSGSHTAAKAAGTYALGNGDPIAVSGTGTLYPLAVIYIAAADYPTVNGVTAKLRIRAQLFTNDVAPTGNYTFGLYPITRPATSGGAGLDTYTLGTVVTGSNGATFTTPVADGLLQAASSDFALPADGFYVIGVVTTSAVATSSHVHMNAQLQMHNN